MKDRDKRIIGYWLLTGVVMIFIQVIIGGITRLTESGLSITEWNVVSGTLPPLNTADWLEEFVKYQNSPQYIQLNQGMSLEDFKFIYFWEWFHRFYARIMGFVFLIPFLFFLISKKFNKEYLYKTLIIFGLGALVAVFGWLMVASGLVDRPMVSPYRLALHLSLAIFTLAYTLWIALELLTRKEQLKASVKSLRKFSFGLTALISVQIILGALLSGMRSAKFYPSWPDMNGEFFPSALSNTENWSWNAFLQFDTLLFPNAFMQFFHRNLAYLISIFILVFLWKAFRQKNEYSSAMKTALLLLPVLLILQLLLGIFTLLNANPTTPVALGVIHQGVAIFLLVNFIFINFKWSRGGKKTSENVAV